jgi:signal transduction histidine kinase
MLIAELVDDEGGLGPDHLVVAAATDRQLERLYREERRSGRAGDSSPLLTTLRTGRPALLAEGAPCEDGVRGAEPGALDRLWCRSWIIVPLTARGQRLGVLGLGSAARAFGIDDLQLFEELGRRAALAIDNARLYERAEAAIRARDDFLSIASHELKTPLTPVMLKLQALLRLRLKPGAQDISADALLTRLESVSGQLDRFSRLIDDLLDISRLSVGKLRLEPEDVDFSALLADVLGRFSDQLRRSGCEIALEAPATLVGRWDRFRLDQIITNLVSNAMKYGPGKPIEISLDGSDAGAALLVIRDHGIGIAPSDQDRIFQRFERAVSERHYGGLGLGLWITRQVVEAMGGSIGVSSRVGEGATFTVKLPRAV